MENALTLKSPPIRNDRHQSVLLIDDNPYRSARLAIWLEMASFSVSSAGSAVDGLTLARQHAFDLILIHSHLIACDGAELCRQVRGFNRRTPVLLYAGEAPGTVRPIDWTLPSEREKPRLPVCA